MKKLLLPMALVALFAFSCSEDEESPDFRADSVGTYTYTSDATYAGGSSNDSGFLKVTKTTNGFTLLFDQGTADELTVAANDVVDLANGYSFDVVSQNLTDSDGDAFQIKGADAAQNSDGTTRHGLYTKDKKMIIGLQTDYVNNDYDEFNQIVVVTATKQ
jgi:hypothetical protein